jgi:hypothetical protein
MLAQEIADHGLARVYRPHQRRYALRIAATCQGGIGLHVLRNFCCVAAADQVQEVLAHGASIVRLAVDLRVADSASRTRVLQVFECMAVGEIAGGRGQLVYAATEINTGSMWGRGFSSGNLTST